MNRERIAFAILRRLFATVPILFGMASIVFVIAHLLPGDPLARYLSPSLSPAVAESARRTFGLDQPLALQYLTWLRHVSVGDFGMSYATSRSVAEMIASAFPLTLLLGGAAFLVQTLLGTGMALLAVRHEGGFLDRLLSIGGMIVYATPAFFLGTLLIAVFAFGLGIVPSAHIHAPGEPFDGSLSSLFDLLRHLILPVATIALPGAAGIARYLRTSILQVLDAPFILSARSFGLTERRILWRHVLPNAMLPAISLGGLELGTLLTGTLVTEMLFSIPGMGRLTVTAVIARDYPVIVACTIISGLVVVLANLLADIVHAVVDPRIRVS